MNFPIKTCPAAALIFLAAFAGSLHAQADGASPRSLFNGQDLQGWHLDVPKLDDNPAAAKPFIVREGLLVSLGTPNGHLITDDDFRDYRLTVEYRFPGKPGNCGVLVHASQPRALYKMFPKSIEVQMDHGNAGDFWCIVEDIHVDNMVERRGPEADLGHYGRQGPSDSESNGRFRETTRGLESNGD